METNKPQEKSRLGRGLSALLPPPSAKGEAGSSQAAHELRISEIVPNTLQPRLEFDEDALEDLAASIRTHGVLQPVLVRPAGGRYELIAGERRYRAAQRAGLTKIPAVVREMTDEDSLTVALIENIQREDLNPMEAARGYQQLMDEFGLTQTDLARQIGKSQPTVANTLALLKLPDPIQRSVAEGRISPEHGRSLLAIQDAAQREALFQQLLSEKISVKDTRKAVEQINAGQPVTAKPAKDVHWQALEDQLRQSLGLRVQIKPDRAGRGSLVISFSSPEEIENLLERLV